MNERIKELAEQAQQYAEWMTPQGLEWFDAFKENFAELIVRECIMLQYRRGVEGFGIAEEQMIKRHFGVER